MMEILVIKICIIIIVHLRGLGSARAASLPPDGLLCFANHLWEIGVMIIILVTIIMMIITTRSL